MHPPSIKKCAMIALTGLILMTLGRQSSEASPQIFILHSYEADHVCGQPQHKGVVSALREAGFREGENLAIEVYHMDTKRKNNTEALIRQQAETATEAIAGYDPDLLITIDDNAFRTVALPLAGTDLPIVFSGLNGQPEDYNRRRRFMTSREKPGGNITGVYEKLHLADAIRVHSKLFPGASTLRIYTDPSPTGRAIASQVRIELENAPLPWRWELKMVESYEAYKEEIRDANQADDVGGIYPAALLLKDGNGVAHTAPEIFAWTVKHSEKPEIAINYAFTRMGLFGGAAVDFFAMGRQAGQMAARILKGEAPGDLPILEAERYALVFNLKRAETLGIDIPPDVLMAADEVVATEPPCGAAK